MRPWPAGRDPQFGRSRSSARPEAAREGLRQRCGGGGGPSPSAGRTGREAACAGLRRRGAPHSGEVRRAGGTCPRSGGTCPRSGARSGAGCRSCAAPGFAAARPGAPPPTQSMRRPPTAIWAPCRVQQQRGWSAAPSQAPAQQSGAGRGHAHREEGQHHRLLQGVLRLGHRQIDRHLRSGGASSALAVNWFCSLSVEGSRWGGAGLASRTLGGGRVAGGGAITAGAAPAGATPAGAGTEMACTCRGWRGALKQGARGARRSGSAWWVQYSWLRAGARA